MTYRATTRFVDLQDGRHLYNAGDTFPRTGLSVTPERIAELAGRDNRMGYPLIEAAETPAEAPESKGKESITDAPEKAPRRTARRKKG